MNEASVKKVITDSLGLTDPVITDVRPTPSGLTNRSYFATVNGEQLVIRIPGSGTEELVNRQEEKENLLFGTSIGINPPMLYFNSDSGLKITNKIPGALPLTPALAREGSMMKQIIHLCKHLHHTKSSMNNEFKLFDLIDHYESLVTGINEVTMEKLMILKKDIVALEARYNSLNIKYVPCHIDMYYANFIKSENDEIFLIDWEYGGMFDPLWDIATVFLTFNLQEEEQFFFLNHYFGREPTEQESLRILMHKIFQDYLWCMWSIFKEAQGDDVGNDVKTRFERVKGNILLYKKYFGEDIVV